MQLVRNDHIGRVQPGRTNLTVVYESVGIMNLALSLVEATVHGFGCCSMLRPSNFKMSNVLCSGSAFADLFLGLWVGVGTGRSSNSGPLIALHFSKLNSPNPVSCPCKKPNPVELAMCKKPSCSLLFEHPKRKQPPDKTRASFFASGPWAIVREVLPGGLCR